VAPGGAAQLLEAFGGHGKSLFLHASINASAGLATDFCQRRLWSVNLNYGPQIHGHHRLSNCGIEAFFSLLCCAII